MAREQRQYTAADLYGPDGRPHAADIRQDDIYNCYFLAPMGALSEQQPDRIRDAVRFNPETGDFNVRLYRPPSAQEQVARVRPKAAPGAFEPTPRRTLHRLRFPGCARRAYPGYGYGFLCEGMRQGILMQESELSDGLRAGIRLGWWHGQLSPQPGPQRDLLLYDYPAESAF